MDTTTFAQKIKAKHPEYQNVDDVTLVTKFLEKYPVYKSQVNLQSETGTDISQTKQAIVDTTNTALNKFEAINQRQASGQQGSIRSALQKLGVGAGYASNVAGETIMGAGKVLLPQSAESAIKTGTEKVITPIVQSQPVQSLLTKYEELKQTNPKLAQDIDSLLGVGQLALDVTGAGIGAKGAESATKTGIKYATGQIADTFNEAKSLISKAETSAPEISTSIMNRVARVKQTEARQFEKIAGESIGSYLTKTGNFGTPDEIVMKEAEKFLASKNSVDEALSSLPGKYTAPEVSKPLDELIARAQRTEDPELSKYIGLKNKLETGGLDMSEINTVKRDFERKYKFSFNKLNSPEQLDKATNIDDQLRKWQFKKADELGFQNLAEINKQTQISKAIVDSLGGKITDNALLNNMSLTDWIMVSGGDPTAVGGLLVKKVFSDPGVQSKIAKYLAGGDIVGIKKPIIGETKLPRLNPGVVDKPTVGTGSTIPVAPAGSNIEFTGQVGGVNRTKQSQQLPKEKLKSASTTVSKKSEIMSSELSTLEQEAKKYKSAEDFVKAQGTPVYRGGADLSKEKITDAGVSVSRGKNVADDFVKQKGGTVQENFISPNAKIVDYDDVPNVKFKNLNDYSPELDTGNRQIWRDLEVEYQKAVNWAKSNGYDGVKLPLEGETRIINPDVLKTKSQLEEIWKKANKK